MPSAQGFMVVYPWAVSMLPPRARGLSALSEKGRADLSHWLGESPFTAVSVGLLAHGSCLAYTLGDPASPVVALIHAGDEPTEPTAFGTDATSLWSLLRRVPGWDCVNVPTDLSSELASILERETGLPSRTMGDLYFRLDRDPVPYPHPMVRRLTPLDIAIVAHSERMVEPTGLGDVATTLADGVVAGAIADGKLVSRVMTTFWSGRYVNVAANTLPDWRGRGLAKACAYLVCSELKTRGKIPTWSTGEPNLPSRRVAEATGFQYHGRREYVILDGLRPSGWRPE